MLLYEHQKTLNMSDYPNSSTDLLNYSNPCGYPHRMSSWAQVFESDTMRTEPCIYFYTSSLALLEHIYGKEVLTQKIIKQNNSSFVQYITQMYKLYF